MVLEETVFSVLIVLIKVLCKLDLTATKTFINRNILRISFFTEELKNSLFGCSVYVLLYFTALFQPHMLDTVK
jgi:hypothetical protein